MPTTLPPRLSSRQPLQPDGERVGEEVGRYGRRRLGLVALGLAAAWAIPTLTHLLGIDLILPPLLVLGTMSLIRGGRTVVDQFVLAVSMMFGALCILGMGISVWPWRLHPVPIAGFGLTVLVLVAVITGLRPRLRWGFGLADKLMLGATALIAVAVLKQFVQRDLAGRLALIAPGEDFARHFILYDSIGQAGGYAFMHHDAVAPYMEPGYGLENYPQGLHFLYSLLDRFWRSATVNGDGVAAMNWLIWCYVGTFIFFGLAVMWAIRRIGGPDVNSWKALPVFGGAAAYVFFNDPITIFMRGFPNEVLSLGLVAIFVAVVARPLHNLREQVVAVVALLAGISFTYYMFLPLAAGLAGCWVVFHRAKLRRRPWIVALGGLFSLCALIPIVTNPKANQGKQLLLAGAVIKVDRHVILALMLIVAAGLLSRGTLRSPAWRTVAIGIAGAAAFTGAIRTYQHLMIGTTIYYYEKAYHLMIVVALVGLGAVVRLLPSISLRSATGWWPKSRLLLPFATLALSVLALFGGLNGPDFSGVGGSWGMGLLHGKEGTSSMGPRDAIWATQNYPGGAGMVTVDIAHGPWSNFYGTLYASVMQRNYRASVHWYVFQAPWLGPKTIRSMERQLLETKLPVRFIVDNRHARFLAFDAKQSIQRNPDTRYDPADAGDDRAMTNVEAAQYLAKKYPDQVEVVWVGT